MRKSPQDLKQRWQASKPPAWVLIHGEETLLQLEAADEIRSWLRPLGFTERQIIEVDRHFKLAQLEHAVYARDLFGSAKLVELRFGAKPHKASIDWLSQWSASADGQVFVMVTCDKLESSQVSSAWFRELQTQGREIAAASIPRHALGAWIQGRMVQESLQASEEVVDLIASRTEGNLLACAQEIKKLAMLGETVINLALASEALTDSARWNAFDLQASCLVGDRKRALMILDGLLAEAEPPPIILWALAEAARQLHALHECLQQGMPRSQAFKQRRMFGARESLFNQALSRHTKAQSLELLSEAAHADRSIKGLGGDAQEALRRLVLAFTAKSATRPDRFAASAAWTR